MKKDANPQDGEPTPDMPEVDLRGARAGHYAGLVAKHPVVYEFDIAGGVTPDQAVPRPIKRSPTDRGIDSSKDSASAASTEKQRLRGQLTIPYVIDNQAHRMADVLNAILAQHGGKSMDVATAYLNVQGFWLLKEGL